MKRASLRYGALTLACALLLASTAMGMDQVSPLAGFGAPKSKCRTCESSKDFRANFSFPIPAHAIVFDFSNGVFWKNSRLLVVDLDGAEAITYRYPPEADRPTNLEIAGRRSIPADQIRELIGKANVVWNPPIPKQLGQMRTDTFQTLYVIDGSVLGKWLEMGGGAKWFVELREELSGLLTR